MTQAIADALACTCIADMNAKLAPHNTRLSLTFAIPRDGGSLSSIPTIQTEKIETRKRGGPALAIASFCPFCGTRYTRATAARQPNDMEGEGRDNGVR